MAKMTKFTKEQAIAIMGFTGFTTCNLGEFHDAVEKRMGRPVFTHEFANRTFADKVKELYRKDFIERCI